MSKARELAELGAVYDSGALSNRNIIINGEMKLAQRGTSFSTSTSTIYTLDRFQSATGSSFNFDLTLTQSTDSPTGFSNSLKITPDSTQTPSGSDNGAIRYNIEAQDLQSLGYGSSDAKKMTLSFYVKSNKTGTYSLQLIGYDGQGTCLVGYTIDASNTWERKTITIDPDTSNAFANDNTLGILIAWQIAGGADDVRTPTSSWALSDTGFRIVSGQVNFMDSTSNEWYLTGVQLEVGSEATPFEHRSFGDELLRCQRYYFHTYEPGTAIGTATANGAIAHSLDGTQTYARAMCFYPVEMRARPTAVAYNVNDGTANQVNGDSTNATAAYAFQGHRSINVGVSNVSFSTSVFLRYQLTADAEL
tara:strand:- start:205 stop:1290 length:1086 start_codon:yes stop_codon:yes gene_type:complete